LVRIAVVLLVLGSLVAVYGGTLIESRWTGSMAPCTRATDIDGSTLQTGTPTMRWVPPVVHCRFTSTTGGQESAVSLPVASASHVAVRGIVAIAALECVIAAVAGAIAVGLRRSRRWQTAPTGA
jgi:hypothetical protein